MSKKLQTSKEVNRKIRNFVERYLIDSSIRTKASATTAIRKIILRHDDWKRGLADITLALLQKKAEKNPSGVKKPY